MKKFEYKVVSVTRGAFTKGKKFAEEAEKELNALGAEGWELVAINGNATLESFITQVFKRELKQQ